MTSQSISEESIGVPAEQERLSVLASYNILDTAPEKGFDDIVLLARTICSAPVALVSFVEADRQWFKASAGTDLRETPLRQAICKHALASPGTLVIPDLTLDPRTRNNPLVTGELSLRFYAGALLQSPEGIPIGTVCVLDVVTRPDGLTADQLASLEALARQVMAMLELRRSMSASEQAATLQRQEITASNTRAVVSDRLADGLRVSEGRMRLAQEAGNVGSFDVDLATNVISMTDQFCAIFGIPLQASARAETLEDIVHPDDRTVASDSAGRNSGNVPLDVQYRIHRGDTGELRWIARRGRFVFGDDGKPVRLLGTIQDITERKSLDAHQKILNEELSHRLKNTLAIVQAIARQTLRNAVDKTAVRAFEDRVNALSHAHDILLRQSWSAADLRELADGILTLHGEGPRFQLTGPPVSLGPRAALSFSLLLHELGTNAQKYGSLSLPQGHVEISWTTTGANLEFDWIETGGPPVVPPTRAGLGTRLIDMGILGTSDIVKSYRATGLELHISVPLAALKDTLPNTSLT